MVNEHRNIRVHQGVGRVGVGRIGMKVQTGVSSAVTGRAFSFFFFSSRRRHTRFDCDWSSDVCSSDLPTGQTYRSVGGSVDRPDRHSRRRCGKSDPLDAYAAARAALAGTAAGIPKTRDGAVEAIRALRVARRSAVKARTQITNQLKALILTGPADLRERLRHLNTRNLIDTCARLRSTGPLTDPQQATKVALRRLARRHQYLTEEILVADAELKDLVTSTAPQLLTLCGVGIEVAGQLLC